MAVNDDSLMRPLSFQIGWMSPIVFDVYYGRYSFGEERLFQWTYWFSLIVFGIIARQVFLLAVGWLMPRTRKPARYETKLRKMEAEFNAAKDRRGAANKKAYAEAVARGDVPDGGGGAPPPEETPAGREAEADAAAGGKVGKSPPPPKSRQDKKDE